MVDLNTMSIGLYYTQRADGTAADPKTRGNIFCGLGLESGIRALDSASVTTEIKNWIDNGKEDALISAFQYPSFLDEAGESHDNSGGLHEKYVPVYNNITQIDGYDVKNRKLFLIHSANLFYQTMQAVVPSTDGSSSNTLRNLRRL